MGQIVEGLVTQFNGGLTEDKRSGWTGSKNGFTTNKYSITKHFDAFTYPHKLVPYAKRETPLGLSGGVITDLKLTRFLYARTTTSTTFRLFGLGDDGSGHVKLYKLDIDGASNLDTQLWVACANGTSSSGARSESVLFYYKSFIYTFSGTTALNRFDVTEVAGWSDGWQTLGTTTSAIRPVHHPNDDIAYFFSDTHVYSYDGSSWTDALTLPADMTITAAWPQGNYLAIAMVTNGNLDKRSIVFLWDRDSSLTTLTDRIDFGEGAIIHGANLNGKMSVVMNFYPDNAYVLSKSKVYIKTPNGENSSILTTLTSDTTLTASDFQKDNMVRNNMLYFPMKLTLNGDTRLGIWAVNEVGAVTLDQVEPSASTFRGIYATANIWWIAFDDGSGGAGAYSVTRTDDDGAYDTSNPSVIELPIFSAGDPSLTKKLIGVTVMTEPLPTAGQVILKYRVDGAVSWTTIFTNTTDNSISHDAVNIESTGAALGQNKELEFRAESTGGAAITGIKFKEEIIDKQSY